MSLKKAGKWEIWADYQYDICVHVYIPVNRVTSWWMEQPDTIVLHTAEDVLYAAEQSHKKKSWWSAGYYDRVLEPVKNKKNSTTKKEKAAHK